MHHSAPGTEAEMAKHYDSFGDSYTNNTDEEALKDVFSRVPNGDGISTKDIAQVEHQYLPDRLLGLFR